MTHRAPPTADEAIGRARNALLSAGVLLGLGLELLEYDQVYTLGAGLRCLVRAEEQMVAGKAAIDDARRLLGLKRVEGL